MWFVQLAKLQLRHGAHGAMHTLVVTPIFAGLTLTHAFYHPYTDGSTCQAFALYSASLFTSNGEQF